MYLYTKTSIGMFLTAMYEVTGGKKSNLHDPSTRVSSQIKSMACKLRMVLQVCSEGLSKSGLLKPCTFQR